MTNWYYRITDDLTVLPDFLTFFEQELTHAKKELYLKGMNIIHVSSLLPSIVEKRFKQLQEIEAVLEYLNMRKYKTKNKKFRHYLEHYNRALTSRDAEKYAEGDQEYYDISLLVNEVALLRNKYLAIHKGLDQLSWQLGNITRLKCAGLDDAVF